MEGISMDSLGSVIQHDEKLTLFKYTKTDNSIKNYDMCILTPEVIVYYKGIDFQSFYDTISMFRELGRLKTQLENWSDNKDLGKAMMKYTWGWDRLSVPIARHKVIHRCDSQSDDEINIYEVL